MSQIIEWYLETGFIKRKVLNKRAKLKGKLNLRLKLRPKANRNACKVYDFDKFGLQK